ncbi:MAG: hypothetical protein SVY15_03560 [Halobacteriota archaeon]|nr:hypothetical protein [Halobacteriota archaeon]
MREDLHIPCGDQNLNATLYGSGSEALVILAPPHPLMGGSRFDPRLVHLAEELEKSKIAALSIDYGRYGGGKREINDIVAVIDFMEEKVERLGVLGYSFGAVVSSNAVAKRSDVISGFATLALLKEIEKVKADLSSDCPKLFIQGRRDRIAPFSDFEKLYQGANGEKEQLVLETDHFFGGVMGIVSESVCDFFRGVLPKYRG